MPPSQVLPPPPAPAGAEWLPSPPFPPKPLREPAPPPEEPEPQLCSIGPLPPLPPLPAPRGAIPPFAIQRGELSPGVAVDVVWQQLLEPSPLASLPFPPLALLTHPRSIYGAAAPPFDSGLPPPALG